MSTPSVGRNAAHVIVLGNEKGGTGKSTTAMHIVVALLKAGHRVASVDTDSRQRSLTRTIENRARWARRAGLALEMPAHYVARLGAGETVREIEAEAFTSLADIVDRVERDFDYVVIDTAANDSYLMRLSHAMADTLITPINDSFVDLDVFGRVDPGTPSLTRLGPYADLVQAARQERLEVDGVATDWIVVRNRVSMLDSRNCRKVVDALEALSRRLGFRHARGISERVVYREFFPMGLTALDPLDRDTQGSEPTMSHIAARQEIRDLIALLKLPADGSRRVPSPAPPGFPGPAAMSLATAAE
jgi:chromosome partitioning protein